MDLHTDEMEFSNEDFKNIYYQIIESFNENKEINVDKFINELSEKQQHELLIWLWIMKNTFYMTGKKIIYILNLKK